jgi:hypothetical protein
MPTKGYLRMNKIYKMERLKRKMKQVERQRSYAWAMFYRAREEEHDSMVRLIQMYKEKTIGIPEHVKNELKDFYNEMKTTISCPICLNEISTGDLDWSQCGRKYCKTCLKTLKDTQNKCAICRRSLIYK